MSTTLRPFAPVTRAASAIVALAALLVAMVVVASPADAHARLENSSPKDGSTLTATPPEVMLRFNEPIKSGLNQVAVTSGSTDATDGPLELDGNTVYQPLKSSLPAGDYKVTYKVVSADGHPVSGTLTFTYAPPGGDNGDDGAEESTTSPDGTGETSTDEPTSATSEPTTTTSQPTTTTAPTTTDPTTTEPTTTGTDSPTTGDGETDPAQDEPTDTSTTTAAPVGSEDSDDGGLPAWAWVAGLGVLLVVAAGIGMAVRGSRRREDDEEIDLEEWHG